MNIKKQTRIASIAGMISSGLWLIGLFIEYRYDLLPPGNGSFLYYADQIIFFIAQAGYLIMLLGLWKSFAVGNGRFGNISLGIFIVGIVSLLITQLVQWFTKNPDFFLYPVGGIFQLLGGLLTGIAIITANRWGGWQKYTLLVQGLYYLIVLFLPILFFNQSPTQLSESLWQVTWFTTSLALFTKSSNT